MAPAVTPKWISPFSRATWWKKLAILRRTQGLRRFQSYFLAHQQWLVSRKLCAQIFTFTHSETTWNTALYKENKFPHVYHHFICTVPHLYIKHHLWTNKSINNRHKPAIRPRNKAALEHCSAWRQKAKHKDKILQPAKFTGAFVPRHLCCHILELRYLKIRISF